MAIHELAGKPVPKELLVNIPRLVSGYYSNVPDISNPSHRVAFGTSGHRGTSLKQSFNEAHILAISQARPKPKGQSEFFLAQFTILSALVNRTPSII
jgi:hypothetical protein